MKDSGLAKTSHAGNNKSAVAPGIGASHSRLSPLGPCILTGLIGRGILLSRSPAMHEVEAQRQGLRYGYRLFDTAQMPAAQSDLESLINAAEQCGFAGVNITFPYKQAVMPLLDRLSEEAVAVGAVNTVTFHTGKRVGHNTDVTGFYQGLVQGLPNANLDCVLLIGAGGAGGAVAHALLKAGVNALRIHDRDQASSARVAQSLGTHFPAARIELCSDPTNAGNEISGIVNATPVGMASHPGSPFPVEHLKPEHWVADVVYFPLETALIRAASALGCKTLTGAAMAVHQAVGAFELFTGCQASPSHMREAFLAAGEINA